MRKIISFSIAIAACTLSGYCQKPTNTEITEFPSWALTGFERPAGVNPVISPDSTTKFYCPLTKDSIDWESNDTFNPAATIYSNKVVVLYRAEDKSGEGIGGRTSRLGYATSADGIHFKRNATPIFYPADDNQKDIEWPGGCEDPRVAVTEDGTYVMMYTQWNKKVPRLAVATTKDLQNWQKSGPAFAKAYNGKFYDEPSKSASIVTEVKNGKQVIKKINGKYFMYWGEHNIYAATSDNLTDWEPLVNEQGKLLKLFSPRPGKFDSHLTECGPPAIVTQDGILLLYNGKNRTGANSDTLYAGNSYCAGQALFDLKDPTKVIGRLDKPFLKPTDDFEKSGQYPAGTVFIEGMAYYKNKWYLYYGCADSRVAVVVTDQELDF